MAADGDRDFLRDRTKPNAAAFGTLSKRTRRLVEAYVKAPCAPLPGEASIFRTRGFAP